MKHASSVILVVFFCLRVMDPSPRVKLQLNYPTCDCLKLEWIKHALSTSGKSDQYYSPTYESICAVGSQGIDLHSQLIFQKSFTENDSA